MGGTKKSLFFILLIVFEVGGFLPASARKVLFIGVDGCRWDAIVAANAPGIDGLLAHAIYSGNGLTEYKTWSGTGWSNMLTGVWHTKHGVTDNTFVGSNYAQYPDFITRAENFNSGLRTISIAHWSSINSTIINSADSKLTYPTDLEVKNAGVNALTNDNPDILFVAFDDVDHAGHTYGFLPSIPNYIQAIETTDGYISQLLTAMSGRPNYASEDWLVVLTTDHGGNQFGHGGGTLDERTIFTIYSNPNFPSQNLARTTINQTILFNEAHFNAGTFAVPANQTPFNFGSTQDFTIELWVKANSYVSDPAFISNKNWNSGVNRGFVISAQSGQYWKVNIGDGTDRLDIQGGFISPNQWHHLAVSFDRNGLMTAYEDGVVVGFELMQNIGNIDASLPLVINQDGTTTYGSNFDGSLRDIRVWNTVIPDTTLIEWATVPVTASHPNYTNLLANWKCEDGTGNTLSDASVNSNHCTVTGAMSWNLNQSNTFVVYDYTETPRQPDNAVSALNWLCIPIQQAWNLDGKSRVPMCNNTALVYISQTSGTNPQCDGASSTFTATPINGGSTPTFQWQVNGVNVGSNNPAYSTSTLSNGQVLRCVMTSSIPGIGGNPASSNLITMAVNGLLTPSVSISQTIGNNPLCSGSLATFTAIPVNGGATPGYQWSVNGVNTGSNSSSFSTTSLTSGQFVSCTFTSSLQCVTVSTVTSNVITMLITPTGNPTVSITQTSGTNPSCAGAAVSFNATVTGGTPSVYQWKVNGVNAGSNNANLTSSSITNGQTVSCDVTSSITCPIPSIITLGAGTSLNGTTSPLGAAYPTYYGNGRQQYIIRASELSGGSAGNILSIGFTVGGTIGDPVTMNGYTVKLGVATAISATNTFQTPVLTTVFGPVNYTPILNSLNTHFFTTPYYWNGTSNLVFDICFSNQVVGHVAYQTLVTAAAFTASTYYQADGPAGAGACNQASGTTTTTRPNMKFTIGATTATTSSNAIAMTITTPQGISGFVPASGIAGTSVVITGANFVNVVDVKFNGVSATSFAVNSPTQITAVVPSSTSGIISVITSPCGSVSSGTIFSISSGLTLNLKLFIEGLYQGAGQMIGTISPTVTDTIIVSLASASPPHQKLFSNVSTLSRNGNGVFSFPSATLGTSYYIVVQHRNCLETWSAIPVLMSTPNKSYDFSTGQSTAFGSNLVNLSDGNFALWSGDINQDGLIESTDYSSIENSSQNFLFGYVPDDLNGDELVESADYSMIENNSQLFLMIARP